MPEGIGTVSSIRDHTTSKSVARGFIMGSSSIFGARSAIFAALAAISCAGADPGPADGDGGATTDGGAGAGLESAGSGGTESGGSDSDSGKPEEKVDFVAGVSVDTLAGSATPGHTDGPASAARFDNPVNVVVTPQGETYVSDFDNSAIRKVSADGTQVGTLFQDPRLVRPFGLALGADGTVYVEADGNPSGQVETTTGTIWSIDPITGEGTILAENTGRPRGLAYRDDGVLLLVDLATHDIRLMDPETSGITPFAGVSGQPGFTDGMRASARFRNPYGTAWSPQSGDLVIADYGNHAVRSMTQDGLVKTLAGTGEPGMVDGHVSLAQFSGPKDVAVTADGSVYVSDTGNHRVRIIRTDGTVETMAGNGRPGYSNGDGPSAEFFGQEGLDVHPQSGRLFVADGTNGEPLPYHRIRELSLAP
jgi:streptogramin lyase